MTIKTLSAIGFAAVMFGIAGPLSAGSPGAAETLWDQLRERRESQASLHQEFDVSLTFQLPHGSQASKRKLNIDFSRGRWRENAVSGSGGHLRIFDGTDMYYMDEDGEEFVRVKHRAKDDAPAPGPYLIPDPDWAKAKEVERQPCAPPATTSRCVLLEIPLKGQATPIAGSGNHDHRVQGLERVLMEIESGALLSATRAEAIQNDRQSYQATTTYRLTRGAVGGAEAPEITSPGAGTREVKTLSRWDAAKLKKQLAGRSAPELTVRDMSGNAISLDDLKGKTVLLDFWTTWCPPCRADGPALDKLHAKYGTRDLAIVGISVSEDRSIVEKFLQEHPHKFPVVLTTENELPRPYQIGIFPTYIVIQKDGTLAGAAQGRQGLADLLRSLKKAGMEIE